MANPRLVIVETHPIQYRAPIFRWLAANGVDLTVLYGSDCSVAGYQDPGFGQSFTWDQDLLAGYTSLFLGTTATGADSPEHASAHGLAEQLARIDPDAVLAMGYSPDFHRQTIRAALAAHIPLLFRAETTHINPGKSRLKQTVRDVWLRRLYRRCTALLYIGESSRRHYRDRGVPERKLFFSPYSVDASPFATGEHDREKLREPARAQLGVSRNDIVLLVSGKLIPRKNPLLAVEAVHRLPEAARERARLVFLGDGALRPVVEARAGELGVKVTITGFINQSALSPYYHAADLLLMPSHFEPWGLVVNDALHHGLPCVVSDAVCSHLDLIVRGETGEVYTAKQQAELMPSINRALHLIGRADVRARCRTQVAGYSPAAAARGIAQAMAAIIAR